MPMKWDHINEKAPDTTGAFFHADNNPPARRLTLWPHRSLPARGFVWFIAITATLFLLPLMALLGTLALWGLLPFLAGALALIWYFLRRSTADGALREVLALWQDRAELTRHNPRKPDQHWHANPHWVEVNLQPLGGPVDNYVTLRGNDRIVEIAAFLSPDERKKLYSELTAEFSRARQSPERSNS